MTGPRKITRRPIVMDAYQYDGANAAAVAEWGNDDVYLSVLGALIVRTPGGESVAETGDWVVCGPRGEHYLVEQAGFDLLYELGE